MRYKKSTIALCIGTAILAGSAMAQQDTDNIAMFAAPTKSVSQLVIQLDGKAALQHGVSNRSDYRNEANAVSEQQQRVFQQILALDSQAKLVGQARLLSNFITVQLSTDAIAEVKTLAGVNSVLAMQMDTRFAVAKKSTINNAQVTSEADNAEEISFQSPYLNSSTAGSGASVAIISTGIDYTLPAFGGSGVYGDDNDPETPPVAGSYMDAFENGAIGPTIPAVADDPTTPDIDESADAIIGFSGFPTDVVVGGWDFISERYGNDGNPIDQNLNYESDRGFVYPTGTGTQLASIVHQLAPGAALYAYKVWNVEKDPDGDETYGRGPLNANIYQALEHALDPNQDGDTRDHVDVALLDSYGAAAFYQPHEQQGTGAFVTQQMIQAAAAQGMAIVTPAGSNAHNSTYGEATSFNLRNWIAWEGAAPAAITVGSAVMADDGETVTPADWSPMGPVRGSNDLKPEVMSFAKDMPVALISNANAEAATMAQRTGADVASARIAAAVAVIKASHPEIGPVELKAILANTADHNIKETDFETGAVLEQAELIHIGHGIENVAAATTTPVAVWNSENNQPYVQFGFHEVSDEMTIVKNITLRNFSDQAQTYNLGYIANGDKAAQSALTINHPGTVSIPANGSVTVAIELMIDGTMLPAWPLTSSEEYTEANFQATELNGYFQLTAEGQPELNVGWMLQARPSSTIDKSVNTDEYPKSLGWNPEIGGSEWVNLAWAEELFSKRDDGIPTYFALQTSFVNESNTPTTYEIYPAIINTSAEPVGKERTYGHKIKTAGGGIYDEVSCASGKKLSIAVNLWQPATNAMANHLDRGTHLFYYDLFPQQLVMDFDMDEGFTGQPSLDEIPTGEEGLLGQPWVELDENGQPATYYIDLSMDYDPENHRARYTKSQLPVRITPNGKNIVSEVCLDELAHHDISDEPDDETIPLMVPELDANGNEVGERVECTTYEVDWLIDNGYFENYGSMFCTSPTGLWDAEGYVIDEDGNRFLNMVENTERGVVGQNELFDFFDQNFGFVIGTDRDTQNVKYAPIAQYNPMRLGYFVPDQEFCTTNFYGTFCETSNVDYSAHGGLAIVDAENSIETADFSHTITVAPHEEVTVVVAKFDASYGQNTQAMRDNSETDVMIISTDDNFAMTSPVSYNDYDGSVVAEVRMGQEFTVTENADYETVVGTIKFDTRGLFAFGEAAGNFDLLIVNALPGTPFAINQETHELYVANPEALDYENNTKFDVMVQSRQGQSYGAAATVTVWLTDLNDVAPEVVAPITIVNAEVTNSSNATITIDVSAIFADVEGNGMTYSVAGLPMGLNYANGMITGTTEEVGTHTITVTAFDGVNETSTSFDLVIADETTSIDPVIEEKTTSSGGGFGGFLLAFAGMSLFRRRK